jgi:hypothetical protein
VEPGITGELDELNLSKKQRKLCLGGNRVEKDIPISYLQRAIDQLRDWPQSLRGLPVR